MSAAGGGSKGTIRGPQGPRYYDEEGRLTADANPNGSARNIAAICNAARNVLGLMPHHERRAEPILGNAGGLAVLKSIAASFAKV